MGSPHIDKLKEQHNELLVENLTFNEIKMLSSMQKHLDKTEKDTRIIESKKRKHKELIKKKFLEKALSEGRDLDYYSVYWNQD